MAADLSVGYAIDIPNCKITSLGQDTAENNIVLNVPFQVLPDTTSAYINWKWHKLA
jgi:hypothetical protein